MATAKELPMQTALVPAKPTLKAKPTMMTASYQPLIGKATMTYTEQTPDYASMTTDNFHESLIGSIDQMQENNMQAGLILATKVLPGLDDAKRRFNAGETIDAYNKIEAYTKSLGFTPEQVRQWRSRLKKKELAKLIEHNPGLLLTGVVVTKRQIGKNLTFKPVLRVRMSSSPPRSLQCRETAPEFFRILRETGVISH
jgi:hypothetical protein